ncbi:hypothetical protein [Hyphomicrobium sp.]|uniref:hypothetical protein n=1 Tax=Hyphomicrobium sp. TaxID=82 RepID=UPI0025C21908|nr:hypothetical protein [Hyphomicrobium sp.]MCC7253825.1 hypothetical protein [Hyphomicrobium sp.]
MMPANQTYTVTSAAGVVLAKGLDKKAAAAMVRELGGHAAATFKQDAPAARFAPAEQFTVREWAETLRSAGYMRRR